MCFSTLLDIKSQDKDKTRIRLSNRFLSPIDLLTRYYAFHANAAVLSPSDSVEREIHQKRAREFLEILAISQMIQS